MPADRGAGPVALVWMVLGEWRAHPARVATAAVAIAIGVALGLAVHLINASALTEFGRAVRTVNGDADLQVHAVSPEGFAEGLYPRLARLEGVAGASPAVESPAEVASGPEGAATLIGLDIMRAARVTPSLIGRPALGEAAHGPAGEGAFDPGRIYLSSAALAASGRKIGDRVTVTAAGRPQAFRIAGDLPGVAEGQKIAVIDIAAAQWRFGRLGRLDRVDLRLAPGADPASVRAAVQALLPPGAQIATRETQARRTDSLSRAYRVNLDMLALVALLTGAFLVYSAQSLAVARRRPQFALLRVLGVERRALLAQVLAEGAVVGAAGAAMGLGLGVALAAAALRLLGGDLGSAYFSGAPPHLVFAPGAAAVFFALGLACAVLGSLIPARQAARAQPAVALKAQGDALDPATRPRAGLPLALLALGGLSALAPAVFGLPLFGYAAMALMLAGGVAAMPWLARVLLAPLRARPLGLASLDLALKRLWGAPSQAAVALCGIVASTSLMIAMAVMVSSFRGSVDEWLTQALGADLYMRVASAAVGGFDPAQQARLAAAPGVARLDFTRTVPLQIAPDRPPVALVAREIAPASAARVLPLIGAPRPVPAGLTPVWLSEPALWQTGARPGDRLSLPLGGRARPVFVAGAWRDYARQTGAIVIGAADYERFTGDTQRADAAIHLKPGITAAQALPGLRAALPADMAGRVEFAEPAAIRAIALRIFDRSFAITYLLEAIAIGVGLAGVAATVSAQTLARTKEFGMLRHLGVLRGQILGMLAAEGALLGAVGVVAGLSLGLAMSQVLIHVVNPQSFHWTMQTRLPLGLFAGVAGALTAAASGTALLAGRAALSADAVRAVREDW